MKNKNTKITLKDDESAIVLSNDGKTTLYFINGSDDRILTFNEQIIATVSIMIAEQDKDFYKLIDEKFDQYF